MPRHWNILEGASINDELWFLALQAHMWNKEGFRETSFSEADQHLLRAICMGIYDQSLKLMDASMRAMCHSSAMADMLWEMLEKE